MTQNLCRKTFFTYWRSNAGVPGKSRGFILVVVLGIMALLSTVIISVRLNTSSIVDEVRIHAQRSDLDFLARSGFETAAARILTREDTSAQFAGSFVDRQGSAIIVGNFVNNAGLVDLNAAPPDLLQAALITAGFSPDASATLAGRIVDWRDEDDERLLVGGSESLDYSGSRNLGSKNRPFESLLELAQVPGFDQAAVQRVSVLMTAFSGLATIHPNLIEPEILENVPGVRPATIARLAALKSATGKGKDSLEDIIAADPLLAQLVTPALSPGWHVTEQVTNENGFEDQYEAEIGLIDNDVRPYRILFFRGPMDRL